MEAQKGDAMARVVIELDDACDACWKRDKTPRESVMEITLDGKTWFLCQEHEKKFANQFVGIMGDPGEGK
jgi:hypothetical protein